MHSCTSSTGRDRDDQSNLELHRTLLLLLYRGVGDGWVVPGSGAAGVTGKKLDHRHGRSGRAVSFMESSSSTRIVSCSDLTVTCP